MSTDWLMHALLHKSVRYTGVALAVLLTLVVLFRIDFGSDRNSSRLWTSDASVSSARQHSLNEIRNSTLGFEKILAINLPERTDHHDGLVLASVVSGLHIEFVEGVHGASILDKVLPAKHQNDVDGAQKGSWRAHINAISRVVEQGWTSALIIEDDIDWDVRLKSQLQDFAIASHHLLSTGSHNRLLKLKDVRTDSVPVQSPYGENWDVLWLGHCGMDLPTESDATVIVHENDQSVPETRHQKSWDVHATSPLADYPQHSRAVAEQRQGTCSLAYAVSQQGARNLLLSLGLRRFDMAFDLMLREWCQGTNGHDKHMCIGVLPQLFDHHRRVGPNEIDSDISPPNGQYRDKAYTLNIRWSVRLNIDKLLKGDTDYDDQWPDS